MTLTAEQILKVLNTKLFQIKFPCERSSNILSLFKCISCLLPLMSSMARLMLSIYKALGSDPVPTNNQPILFLRYQAI